MNKKHDKTERRSEYTLVYSTSDGRICPGCSNPMGKCACRGKPAPPSGDGIVRVSRSTKGRGGKGVTVITGLPLAGEELKGLAARLKQRCGAGGAVKDGTVEIQGEHRDLLVVELVKLGYNVKKSGG